ncbi:MAG: ABC transporter permease [Nitrososphaeria archaeon]
MKWLCARISLASAEESVNPDVFQVRGAGMQGATASFSYTPIITLDVFGIALITTVSVSVLSGLYPAWRASKMEPIKALRYE